MTHPSCRACRCFPAAVGHGAVKLSMACIVPQLAGNGRRRSPLPRDQLDFGNSIDYLSILDQDGELDEDLDPDLDTALLLAV